MVMMLSVVLFVVATAPANALHVSDPIPADVVVTVEMEQIGDVDFPIACDGADAQRRFNRGLALLHHMTYEVAEREFRAVAEADPQCAMAHWGVAMTLAHPVWPGRPSEAVLRRGASEVAHARQLGGKTPRERAYIEAIGAFYDGWETDDHATRLARWNERQRAIFDAHSTDDDAAALHALLAIATAPKGDLSYATNRAAGAVAEGIYARRPRHPGAIHYGIHAYDNPRFGASPSE